MIPCTEAEAVKQYQPFVAKLAKSYSRSGASFDDLMQEGLLAVALAFRQWRPDGGANFLTWIHRPVHFAMRRLLRETFRRGGSHRGAKRQDIHIVSLDRVIPTAWFKRVAEQEIVTLHDFLAAPEVEEPDVLANQRIAEARKTLPVRAQKVLRLRYDKGLSPEETAAKLRLSKKTVEQVELDALERLKAAFNE